MESGGRYPLGPAADRLWERALCAWTARDHRGCPSRCQALGAWCALRSSWRARPCPPLSGLRPSLHVSSPSLRDSLCASAPSSLHGCACRLSAPPPPQDARGARPGEALAAWRAEGVGRAGGGGRGRGAGARASPRAVDTQQQRRNRGGDWGGEGVEQKAGAGTQSRDAEVGTEVTEARLGKTGFGTQREGRGRSVPPTPDAQPALSRPLTHVSTQPATFLLSPFCPPPLPLPLLVESRVSQPRTGTQRHREAQKSCTRA